MKAIIFRILVVITIAFHSATAQQTALQTQSTAGTRHLAESVTTKTTGLKSGSKQETKMVKAKTRVLSHLGRHYQNPQNVEWSAGKDFIMTKFGGEGTSYHVYYTRAGRWLQELRFIFPTALPADVKQDFTKAFPE